MSLARKSIWIGELKWPITLTVAVTALLAVAAVNQVLRADWMSAAWAIRTLAFTGIYALLYALIFSSTAWASASCWLGIPVLVFVATWLKSVWAWPLVGAILIVLFQSIRANGAESRFSVFDALPGALLIICWVSVSGTGGYGFQNSDYVLHNGRLIDLVENMWPVSYQEGVVLTRPEYADRHLLVLYSGYYILAALVGKLSNIHGALDFLHIWTLAGCWIALRFLQDFSNMCNAIFPALLMIGCGGFDLWGMLGSLWLQDITLSWELVTTGLQQFWFLAQTPIWLDFWAGDVLVDQYHFGNFISLTAELFWAPHHTVASWLSIALLYMAWQKQNYTLVGFNAALLTYFSPLMSIVVFPFVLVMVLQSDKNRWREWISLPNIIGISIVAVFAVYYCAGSVSSNPAEFISLKNSWPATGFLLYFYLFSWGLYALVCGRHIANTTTEKGYFFITTFFMFAILPLFRYGLWNDLMVRASGLLYFCVVILLLDAIKAEAMSGRYVRVAALTAFSLLSWPSALLNINASLANPGYQEPSQRVVDYWDGWEELGSLDSVFVRYLAAPLRSASAGSAAHSSSDHQ